MLRGTAQKMVRESGCRGCNIEPTIDHSPWASWFCHLLANVLFARRVTTASLNAWKFRYFFYGIYYKKYQCEEQCHLGVRVLPLEKLNCVWRRIR